MTALLALLLAVAPPDPDAGSLLVPAASADGGVTISLGLDAVGVGPMPTFTALRTEQPPVIDGKLDDPVWKLGESSKVFTQVSPEPGAKPTVETEVRFAYDAKNLYVAFNCKDPDASQVSNKLTRRDRYIESDYIALEIDSRGDKKSAFGFGVYPTNVQLDYMRTGDNAQDIDFDAVWTSATQRTPDGWTAEFAIPFSVLRFEHAPNVAFRVEVARYVSRKDELDELVFQPPDQQGNLLRMANLVGFRDLAQGNGLELRPFVLASFDRRYSPGPGYDPPSGSAFKLGAGGEIAWHPTSGLTLDAAVLPDFGQVEADQVILNLSTFEIFFPEKRPFFLSGAELFTLHDELGNPITTQLFYSRRVGRPPPYPVYGDQRLLDQPLTTDIWGALKLTGKISDKVTVALLDAVSRRELATLGNPDGTSYQVPVVPLSNFGVARLRAELGDGFTLGAMATGVTRRDRGDMASPEFGCPVDQVGNTVAPVINPVAGRCSSDAYTGGIDSTWTSPSGTYVAMATLLGSKKVNGPDIDQPDGTIIQGGDSGVGGLAQFAKAGGNWLYNINYEGYSPKLDLNEAGYLRQQNLHMLSGGGDYRTTKPAGPTLNTDTNVYAQFKESTDGVDLSRHMQISESVQWKNFWYNYVELDLDPGYEDDRELRDGSIYQRAPGIGGGVFTHTDSRKAVSLGGWVGIEKLRQGKEISSNLSLTIKPSDALEIDLLPQIDWSDGDPRWFFTDGDLTGSHTYYLGNLDARSTSATLRGTYTFTPTLSLQAYAQLFFATGHFGPYFAVPEGPGRSMVQLSDLTPMSPAQQQGVIESIGNPDFKDGNLNVNVLLRWEYRPGSVAYLVYTRSQVNGDLTPQLSVNNPDLASLRHGPYDDVLLLKVSYYFGT